MTDAHETGFQAEEEFPGPGPGVLPQFRAWYSSSPMLTYNTGDIAPAAADTIFVRDPSITEALEAVQANSPNSHIAGLDPIDPDLALRGLKKIKAGQDLGGLVLPSRLEIADAFRFARNLADNQNNGPASSEDVQTAAVPEQPSRPLLNEIQWDLVGNLSPEIADQLRFFEADPAMPDVFIDLAQHFSVDGRGEVQVLSSGRYRKAAARLTESLVGDTEVFFDFMQTGLLMGGEAAFNDPAPHGLATKAVRRILNDQLGAIGDRIMGLAEIRDYGQRCIDLISKLRTDGFESYYMKMNGLRSPSARHVARSQDISMTFRAEALLGVIAPSEIALYSSLIRQAKSKPAQTFDTLYELAHEGLDPRDATKFGFAARIVIDALKQSAELAVVLGLDARQLEDPKRFAKIIDLSRVLSLCGWNIFDHAVVLAGGVVDKKSLSFLRKARNSESAITPDNYARGQEELARALKEDELIFPRIEADGNPLTDMVQSSIRASVEDILGYGRAL